MIMDIQLFVNLVLVVTPRKSIKIKKENNWKRMFEILLILILFAGYLYLIVNDSLCVLCFFCFQLNKDFIMGVFNNKIANDFMFKQIWSKQRIYNKGYISNFGFEMHKKKHPYFTNFVYCICIFSNLFAFIIATKGDRFLAL